jgi:hypothetical protein
LTSSRLSAEEISRTSDVELTGEDRSSQLMRTHTMMLLLDGR